MLEVDNISVSFPGFSLRNISFRLEQGEYLVLLGVSGAGKTVLLEVLAGLVKPDSGRVLLNGEDITRHRIQERGIGLVYQDLSLFPHMTVAGNIAYPLKKRGYDRMEIHDQVETLATQTGIPHLLDRYPGTLSGGEAQRVALARTLASNPEIMLLDEPLANLDVKLKGELRSLLRRIHRSGKTMIHVTHDFMEAATLATCVAVIEKGSLAQFGSPESVFRHPASEFVARFSGVKNLFPCKVTGTNGNQPIPDDSGLNMATCANGQVLYFVGRETTESGFVMVPQEDIFVSEDRLYSSAVNQMQGTVREVYLSGNGVEVVVGIEKGASVRKGSEMALGHGETGDYGGAQAGEQAGEQAGAQAGEQLPEAGGGLEMVVSVSRSSREKLRLDPGRKVWLSFKASAVRFIPD